MYLASTRLLTNWFRLSGEFDFFAYPLKRHLHEVVYPHQVMLSLLEYFKLLLMHLSEL